MKTLNQIILIAFAALSSAASAQVIIGDEQGTATDKTSVLLEFANTNNRGIVLPYVRTLASNPTEGSILLDVSNPTDARVKYFNGKWEDLSGQGADVTSILATQPSQSEVTETADAKVIIGSETSTVNDGVLVLESNTKAMVLPHVSDVNNIPSPSAGMMVFVNKAGAKLLAVYNGSKWSFWKP